LTISLTSIFTVISLVSLVFVGGCASDYKPAKTGLQLQAFQKQEFEATKKIAFASTMSVFQDLGYAVGSADFETGFITAKSPTQSVAGLFTTTVMKDAKATAFIEELRTNSATVRLNFVMCKEESGAYGAKRTEEKPVEDPAVYREVFTKIQQAIFVRSAAK
jgi:hypothetical protein